MRKIVLEAATGRCEILVGERLESITDYVSAPKVAIVTDTNVKHMFALRFPKGQIAEIAPGEASKSLETVQKLYERFLQMELERSSLVIAIGGGVVCDIAGFAASTYLRGVRMAFAPTTLLAQVDAGVGGKNGVNFKGYKNLVGVVCQPELVICDLTLLENLPKSEIRHGFSEIVKSAAIGDAHLFSFLEEHLPDALALKRTAIEKCVEVALSVKVKIVQQDESEAGERRKLNFGHTLGHAIEKTMKMPHGDSISIGMAAAAKLSVKKGKLKQQDADRLIAILEKIGLPTKTEVDKAAVIDAVRKDKKREEDAINFVLLEGIGKAVVEKVSISELEAVL